MVCELFVKKQNLRQFKGQLAFTCPKLTIGTLKQGGKYVQS